MGIQKIKQLLRSVGNGIEKRFEIYLPTKKFLDLNDGLVSGKIKDPKVVCKMRRSTFFYIESIACGLAIIAGITIFSDISDQDKFIEELKSGKLDSVVKRDGNKWHTYNGHEMTETEFLQIRDNLITIRRLKYQKGRFFPELLFEYNPRANYITGNPNYIKSLNLDNLLEQYGKQK